MRKRQLNKSVLTRAQAKGFTLLEVLFAFMIMVTGIAILFENQSRSFRMLEKGKAIVIGSQLARSKLLDCKSDLLKEGFSVSDFSKEGDFSEDGFEGITWECRGTPINAPAPNVSALSDKIGKGPEDGTSGSGVGAFGAVLGPIFSLLASSLGDSARELTATVRWAKDTESISVTTHVIDSTAFAAKISAFSLPKIPGGDEKP